MTDDVVWATVAEGVVVDGPLRGDAYVEFQSDVFPGFHVDLLGERAWSRTRSRSPST
jgi:hypothetical protein